MENPPVESVLGEELVAGIEAPLIKYWHRLDALIFRSVRSVHLLPHADWRTGSDLFHERLINVLVWYRNGIVVVDI